MSVRDRDIWRHIHPTWSEFIPAIHYDLKGKSLCGVKRSGNKTLLSRNKPDITCKNCVKKLLKNRHFMDHFDEELFTI